MTSRHLRARLLATLAAPLLATGCWETVHEQGVYTLVLTDGAACPNKEDLPTGGTSDSSSNCHPRVIISFDEGPTRRETQTDDGRVLVACHYLVTREQTFTPENSICIGGGRPLIADVPRVARLVRGVWG